MNYDQHHLRDWLISKSLINITELEKQSNCPKDTIRHFLKDRRNIADNHFTSIESVLTSYGYTSLNF
jgi:hemerythrin